MTPQPPARQDPYVSGTRLEDDPRTASDVLSRSANRFVAADGTPVLIRPIGPADVAMARRFLDSLSRGTRYFRFGRGTFSYTDEELTALCRPSPERRGHLIAVTRIDGTEEMVGSARYVVTDLDGDCEFAVMMRDGWTKRGIAAQLMDALERLARERGLRTMHGRILGSNTGMLAFAQRLGYVFDEPGGPAQIRSMVKALAAPNAPPASRATGPAP